MESSGRVVQLDMAARATIRFRLGNRKTGVFADSPETLLAVKKHFQFKPLGFQHMPKFQMGQEQVRRALERGEQPPEVWDGNVNMLRYGTLPTGLLLDRKSLLEQEFNVKLDDLRQPLQFRTLSRELMAKARLYQLESLEAMKAASATGGIILSATGSGKTLLAGLLAYSLIGTMCFCVDELTALIQTQEVLQELLQDEQIGIVGKGEFNPQRITVATVQSLNIHRKRKDFQNWFKKLDVLVVDELHVQLNKRNIDVVRDVQPKAVYGLTATLELDKPYVRLPAMALTGPVIYTYPIQEGQREGYLAQGVAMRVRVAQSLEEEFLNEYTELIVESRTRNQCIAGLVDEGYNRNHTIVVLVERLRHLKLLSTMLEARLVPHQILCGKYKVDVRRDAQRSMEQGELKVILTNRIFSKSVNITSVDTIIDGTAGAGRNAVIQRFGRGIRQSDTKLGLIHFDIADCAPKSKPGTNPFSKHSAKRWKALKELEISIDTLAWNKDAKMVWNRAEALLDKQVANAA